MNWNKIFNNKEMKSMLLNNKYFQMNINKIQLLYVLLPSAAKNVNKKIKIIYLFIFFKYQITLELNELLENCELSYI